MNIFKLIFIYLILSTNPLTTVCIMAQCDITRYYELIKDGDGYLNGEADYQKAMNAYSAAMIACRDKMPEVQKKILSVFNQINSLKMKAEEAKKVARDEYLIKTLPALQKIDSAYRMAEKEKNRADSAVKVLDLIRSNLCFYKNRFAPTVIKTGLSRYLYGFIDKQGNTVIDFNYDEAFPFNERTGFSKVKQDRNYYLIDTTATKEYPLCEDLGRLNDRIWALDLSYRNLTEIPELVFDNKQLNILLLSYNSIKQIPSSISNLSQNLFFLDLSKNEIAALPLEIGDLLNLTHLNLWDNPLRSLPASIGKLANLEKVNIASDSLTSLPVEIGDLNNLTETNISHNLLESIPVEMGKLTSLISLDLSFNKLKTLPNEIGNLRKLTSLYLAGNDFQERDKQKVQQMLPNCRIFWDSAEVK